MIATIGDARVRATIFISTTHPRDISSSTYSSSSSSCLLREYRARESRARGRYDWDRLVEALKVGQNACDF